jgi:hypothetical protein
MTKYFMKNRLFKSILKESKDYKFKAKVGDFWLQKDDKGWRLCDDKLEADEFESETEPRQIINQMQKNGEIKETSKVEIIKIKESINLFNKILKEANLNESYHECEDFYKKGCKLGLNSYMTKLDILHDKYGGFKNMSNELVQNIIQSIPDDNYDIYNFVEEMINYFDF